MSREDDELVLGAVARARPSPTGWRRGPCPFCELLTGRTDRKFSIGVSTRGFYNCFKCETKGWLADVDAANFDDEPVDEAPAQIEWPEGFYLLSSEDARTSSTLAPAYDYLRSRGAYMTDRVIERARIGACAKGRFSGRVVVPMFGESSDLSWFVARSWTKKAEKPYLYPSGSRGDFIYDPWGSLGSRTSAPLLVMEGAFDALAHPNAVAVLGKTTEAHEVRLTNWAVRMNRPVVLVPDGDMWEVGDEIARRMRLRDVRAGSVHLAARRDPDEIGVDELLALARETLS